MIVKNSPITEGLEAFDIVNLLSCQSKHKYVLLDIETTGFTPKNSQLYMIGCIHFSENSWIQTQWLAETFDEEWKILQEFLTHFQGNFHFITYNGDRFDLSYLTDKKSQCQCIKALPWQSSLDLYKLLKPYKKMLNFSHMKQRDLENFLGFNRKYDVSGKECVTIYQRFLRENQPEQAEILLNHNRQDLLGVLKILSMLTYTLPSAGDFQIEDLSTDQQSFKAVLRLPHKLPKSFSWEDELFHLQGDKEMLAFKTPLSQGRLKKFYPNYSDYFYLPGEDMAVHKSLATYIDRSKKKKATARTCYTWFDCNLNFLNDIPTVKDWLTDYFRLAVSCQ